jgi:hypothetical protein
MNYKIIDNFLEKHTFMKIKELITNPNFSWNYSQYVAHPDDKDLNLPASYYFMHMFYSGFHMDSECHIFSDVLNKLGCLSLIRIKTNLYPSTKTIIHHNKHVDYEFPHKGAILYLNTNNGLTVLENGEKIDSVENRVLLFDPSKPHNSTTCTDDKCRVNVNFNFF